MFSSPETSTAGASSDLFNRVNTFTNSAANLVGAIRGTKTEPASQPVTGAAAASANRAKWLPYAIVGGVVVVLLGVFLMFRRS